MPSRVCKKCGWEVDRKSTLRSCPVCSTKYDEGYCAICGAYCTGKDYMKYAYCRDCYNEVYGAPTRTRQYKEGVEATRNAFEDWMNKIAKVPTTYPTLTEEQWLEVCRHFGGCAICGDIDISARAFFIPFKDGGRYCDWNIIPMCEACSIKWQTFSAVKHMNTPFSNYLQRDNGKQVLKNIQDYLEVKLDAAQR